MNQSNSQIDMAFFSGENAYKQPGKIARNVLRRDYQRHLYTHNLPRDFDQQELEKIAKAYKGPQEQERIRVARQERKKLIRAVQSG